ncbi:hypothetical protein LV84_04263 [Algoriphagus ratkowskyi]|uniref:Uncharacterized protein n=1 Tax=Algoriphagus ratkowskyi TaxID=57028 RepID=A0A2W7QTB5_9BACT|nr:hypothetical protein LV84_04263 [Algoriphagus ratkowskyi]
MIKRSKLSKFDMFKSSTPSGLAFIAFTTLNPRVSPAVIERFDHFVVIG